MHMSFSSVLSGKWHLQLDIRFFIFTEANAKDGGGISPLRTLFNQEDNTFINFFKCCGHR